jgi:hypothetical protein
MACTITFKAKRRSQQYVGHPELHSEYIEVPTMQRKYCDMNAFRNDTKFGSYANSDLFPAMLKRELTRLGIGDRIKFEDQFGKYEIPACVSIVPGFLDTVTITL